MATRRPGHHCHAYACEANVPPSMLMCRKHWRMVPKAMQDRLWDNYRIGQERRMDPSAEYLHAAAECVRTVAAKEGHDAETVEADPSVAGYMAWAEMLEVDVPSESEALAEQLTGSEGTSHNDGPTAATSERA